MEKFIEVFKEHKVKSIIGIILIVAYLLVSIFGIAFYFVITAVITTLISWLLSIPVILIILCVMFIKPISIKIFPSTEEFFEKYENKLKNKLKSYEYKKILDISYLKSKKLFMFILKDLRKKYLKV